MSSEAASCINLYLKEKHVIETWMDAILTTFRRDPDLNRPPMPIIHSLRSRMKDPEHLREKLERKSADGNVITPDNLFSKVTDLAGIRVLHVASRHFDLIHNKIEMMVKSGDWRLAETPVAYSWDPDRRKGFEQLGLRVEIKDSNYTSIHYLVRPSNEKNIACCEVQVRTLFEEVWGEVDHLVNYPTKNESDSCRRQLRVLARAVSTGTTLVDSMLTDFEGSPS